MGLLDFLSGSTGTPPSDGYGDPAGGLLSPDQRSQINNTALANMAAAIGVASAPSRMPISLGQVLGPGAAAYFNTQNTGTDQALRQQLTGEQLRTARLQNIMNIGRMGALQKIAALQSGPGGQVSPAQQTMPADPNAAPGSPSSVFTSDPNADGAELKVAMNGGGLPPRMAPTPSVGAVPPTFAGAASPAPDAYLTRINNQYQIADLLMPYEPEKAAALFKETAAADPHAKMLQTAAGKMMVYSPATGWRYDDGVVAADVDQKYATSRADKAGQIGAPNPGYAGSPGVSPPVVPGSTPMAPAPVTQPALGSAPMPPQTMPGTGVGTGPAPQAQQVGAGAMQLRPIPPPQPTGNFVTDQANQQKFGELQTSAPDYKTFVSPDLSKSVQVDVKHYLPPQGFFDKASLPPDMESTVAADKSLRTAAAEQQTQIGRQKNTLDVALALQNDPSFNSGKWEDLSLPARAFLSQFGFSDASKVNTQEAFNSSLARLTFQEAPTLNVKTVRNGMLPLMQEVQGELGSNPQANKAATLIGQHMADWDLGRINAINGPGSAVKNESTYISANPVVTPEFKAGVHNTLNGSKFEVPHFDNIDAFNKFVNAYRDYWTPQQFQVIKNINNNFAMGVNQTGKIFDIGGKR